LRLTVLWLGCNRVAMMRLTVEDAAPGRRPPFCHPRV
jgi:hypothetical protein